MSVLSTQFLSWYGSGLSYLHLRNNESGNSLAEDRTVQAD
jgi:hypothetical protein